MKKKIRILVGDRNSNIRDILERELRDAGYEVDLAVDGRQILAKAETQPPPDLIIMDLFVQIIDGLAVLQKLAALPRHIPVIVHTSLLEYRDEPCVARAEAFIEKDGRLDLLMQKAEEMVKKYCSAEAGSPDLDMNFTAAG